MALPGYRIGSTDITCPCCGKGFIAESEPISCPNCGAMIEEYGSRAEADQRVQEYGGTIHAAGNGKWLVAFCNDGQSGSLP